MKAYFGTQDNNVDFTVIDWRNTYCLSRDPDVVKLSRDSFHPQGMVVEIEMDDIDVVAAVLAAMHGNSCAVKIKVIKIIHPPLPKDIKGLVNLDAWIAETAIS